MSQTIKFCERIMQKIHPNLSSRINQSIDKMSTEEKYKLLNQLEVKNLGYNENENKDFIEAIVNVLLDITAVVARFFKII